MSLFKKLKVKNELGTIDRPLYELGIVALGIFLAAVLLYCVTGFSFLKIKYWCMFNRITRLPCPGCGGTRSFRAMLRGEFLKSLYDYPPLIPAIVTYLVFMIRCFLYKYFGIKKSPDGTIIKYIYIFIGLVALQWVVKIVAQLKFDYYWFL